MRAYANNAGEVVHSHCRRGAVSPTYRTWDSMIGRCTRPTHGAYHKYGAKGVRICDEWRRSFLSFLQAVGERPEGKTLDRIDNARGYEPTNCRWATRSEQERNKRKRSDQWQS